MTVLCDLAIPRTLDSLMARLSAERPGGPVEAWLFEDAEARRAAEARLAAAGISATLRSAYKPLLHWVLEEVESRDLRQLTVRYPRHPQARPERFLAETYPLAALVPGVVLEPGDEDLAYTVELACNNGGISTHTVFAPNLLRDGVLANCGWLRVPGVCDEVLETEFETLFHAALEAVRRQPWRGPGPYFDRLTVRVDMPGRDHDLGCGEEVVSFREAMHEDLFFSLREHLTEAAGGDRHARPGQVVPDIRPCDGDARLRIEVSAFETPTEPAVATLPLATADRPLGLAQIRAELAALGQLSFAARSREGRAVGGLYKHGAAPAVLITAGQHANETTGPVGALRAAAVLARDPDSHFALVPVENVDGYALHGRLIGGDPRHMHHAARYTAFGDDVSSHAAEPAHERLARFEGLARSGARLHINLHGYPSHEWTRPLSGYLPRGFEAWSMPKGFFLIVMHHPGWAVMAQALLERVASALAAGAELVAFNQRQLALMRAHSLAQPFSVIDDIPYFLSEDATGPTPLTLITEAPDETVYGPAFVMQQAAQMRAVLACCEAYRELAAS